MDNNNFEWIIKSSRISERKIPEDNINLLEEKWIISYEDNFVLFTMKDLDWNIVWHQKRLASPKKIDDKVLKSMTCPWEHVWYYFTKIDYTKPIVICEWEIDFLSICNIDNLVGIQWVQNLKKLVDWLIKKDVPEIYILVDHDGAWDNAIWKLFELWDEQLAKIYDSRLVLLDKKDVNEVLQSWWIINKEEIIWFGKSLLEHKRKLESFFIESGNWSVRVNYSAFAKFLVEEKDIASSSWNVFIYNRYWKDAWIRHKIDKYTFESYVRNWMDQYLWYKKNCFSKQNKNELIDAIFDYSHSEKLNNILLEQNSTEVCLKDCILDIKTRQTHNYRKEDFKFNKFQYSLLDLDKYNPTKFLKFLDEILDWYWDKEKIIQLIQEYMGLLAIPYIKFEKALLIYWSWCNGKWVLLNLIQKILWDDNCSTISLHEIKEQQYLYGMIDKLANIDFDVKDKVRLDDWTIKKIISWEKVSAKVLYKNPIQFKPICRLLIATNILPYIKSIDDSITRRFIFIHLKNSFKDRINVNLLNEIMEEKSEIFAWMIQWLKRLLNRWYFNIPESLIDELNNFIERNDIVLQFIKDDQYIIQDSKWYISLWVLYDSYKYYCYENGYKALWKHNFDERVEKLWFEKIKKWGEWCFIWLYKALSGHLDI